MADDGEGQVSGSRGIMSETSRPIADLDIADVIRALTAAGAATVPGILGDEARRRLLEEARALPFIAAPAVVGSYGVRQRYATVTSFPPGGAFQTLQEAFQTLLDERLARLPAYPFATPLRFNASALHRYPPGRLGISPHRDSARSVNLIAVFVLEGKARFFVCRDRDGRDAVDLPNAPGDLILLRAPGLMGADVRPFHGVADIAEQRTTFALRQQQIGL
jgi:hypothetical protein